jgi:hypothetical protein
MSSATNASIGRVECPMVKNGLAIRLPDSPASAFRIIAQEKDRRDARVPFSLWERVDLFYAQNISLYQ